MPDMERYLPGSLWSHLSGRAAGEHPDHSATSTTSSHCNNADRARLLNWIINNKNTCLLDWNARLDCTGCFQGVVTWQYLPALYKNAPHQSDREGRALFRSGLSSGQAVATLWSLGWGAGNRCVVDVDVCSGACWKLNFIFTFLIKAWGFCAKTDVWSGESLHLDPDSRFSWRKAAQKIRCNETG